MELNEKKLVIRLLPPTLTQTEFFNQLRQLILLNYLQQSYYVQGKLPVNPYETPVYSRCYLFFKNRTTATDFVRQVKDQPFKDANDDAMVPQISNSLFKKMIDKNKMVSKDQADVNKNSEQDSSLDNNELFLAFKKLYDTNRTEEFSLSLELEAMKAKQKKQREKHINEKKLKNSKNEQRQQKKNENRRVEKETTPKVTKKQKEKKKQPKKTTIENSESKDSSSTKNGETSDRITSKTSIEDQYSLKKEPNSNSQVPKKEQSKKGGNKPQQKKAQNPDSKSHLSRRIIKEGDSAKVDPQLPKKPTMEDPKLPKKDPKPKKQPKNNKPSTNGSTSKPAKNTQTNPNGTNDDKPKHNGNRPKKEITKIPSKQKNTKKAPTEDHKQYLPQKQQTENQ